MIVFNEEHRASLVMVSREIHQRQMVVATGGNLSIREAKRLLVSPTGCSLGRVTPDELVVMDLDGRAVDQGYPSKEWRMHVALYEALPDARAVVHLHSFYSMCVGMLHGVEVGTEAMPHYTKNLPAKVGPVPLVGFHTPGSAELAAAVKSVSQKTGARALLLQNHGLIAAGSDIWDAFYAAEIVEENARLHIELDGRGKPLEVGVN